jgi:PIN domain nuclease of toxin-antitoxin system
MLILDTHIFLWMNILPNKISKKILSAIADEDVLGIPAISLWEIAMLADKKRISLPRPTLPWLQQALTAPKMRLLPITPEIAALSATLSMHGDPADRMIAATAIVHACPLATVDDLLCAMPELITVV